MWHIKIRQSTRSLRQCYHVLFLVLAFLLTSFHSNTIDPRVDPPSTEKFIVVLDAGHGGHDPGNLGNGYLEKNIALNIVLNVGKILAENQDIEVIYTRDDDTFVDLFVRGEIANKANADLFVSVHCDSHTSNAHGAGTFVLGLHANKQNFEIAKKENSVIYLEDNYETRYAEYDINSPESVIGLTIMQEEFLDQSILLAKMMQDNFSVDLKRTNRKVKQAGFIVLHQTFMPSVLVETGFLTNAEEGAYLNSKKGQSEMAKAIAKAILDYRKNIALGVQSTTQTPDPVVTVPDPKTPKEETVVEAPQEVPVVVKEPTKEEVVKEVVKDSTPVTPPVVVSETPTEEVTKTVNEMVKEPSTEIGAQPTPTTAEKPTTAAKSEIVFKVQILASSKNLELRSEDFRGLNTLSKEPYKNLFRYMYGNTDSYEQAKLLKSNADVKGYTSSYIVVYKDGVRVPLKEVIK